MLPRKDWSPETVVRLLFGVTLTWLMVSAAGSIATSAWRQEGRVVSPLVLLVVGSLGLHGTVLAGTAWALARERLTWTRAFGLNLDPAGAVRRGLVWTLGVAPLVYVVHAGTSAILEHFGFPADPQASVELLVNSGWTARWILAALAVGVAPVAEEVLFRGWLFVTLRDAGWHRSAWYGVAIVFGLIHGNPAALVPLTAFGWFLSWLYDRTGNLWAPIAAHALFNTVPFVLLAAGVRLGS